MADYHSSLTGSEIDAALTRAKAGGEIDTLLQNKAPAGYGLGEIVGKTVSDANMAVLSGWYYHYGSTNAPYHGATPLGYGMILASAKQGYVWQTYFANTAGKHVKLQRYSTDNGSTWTEWEYEDPPMEIGVEYRTTERFFGRPVYYKIVDCGKIADNKQVEHGIVNMRDCISFQGLRGGMPMPSISNNNLSDPWSYYVADVNRTKITLACGTSATGGNCHVMLKYTKTTD